MAILISTIGLPGRRTIQPFKKSAKTVIIKNISKIGVLMDNRRKYFFIYGFITLFITLFLMGCQFFPPSPKQAKWTVLVYMAADNDLERAAIKDFNEMELVGSSEDVNIIVQIDRISTEVLNSYGYFGIEDTSNGNWTNTRRYLVTQDFDISYIDSKLLEELGEVNMGSLEALRDFGYWGIKNYPANHYFIILWNHGNGFRSVPQTTRGISWDYTDDNDFLTMVQLSEALSFIAGQTGKKIDIVGMDACLMSMIEVAYQIKDSSDIMIASEENISLDGWNYQDVLDSLVQNPMISPEEFANIMIEYTFQNSQIVNRIGTNTAVDLSYMVQLSEQVDFLAQSIIDDQITPKQYYIDAVELTQHYADKDFIDLKDFALKVGNISLDDKVNHAAQSIVDSLTPGKVIINHMVNQEKIENSYGLSIYFPLGYYDTVYDELLFSQDTKWIQMLNDFNLWYNN